jgi:hypothetical protein
MSPALFGPPYLLLLIPLAVACTIIFHLIADRGIQ